MFNHSTRFGSAHRETGDPSSTRRKRDLSSIAFAVAFLPLIFGFMHNSDATADPATALDASSSVTQTESVGAPQRDYVNFTVWVTAYSSSVDETSSHPFITASGKHVRDGIIASNFLPFGTKVIIPTLFGNRVFTVEDRMARRKTDFVDIWMPSKQDALDFGIHHTQIYILSDSSS